jgi:hypothetical protein
VRGRSTPHWPVLPGPRPRRRSTAHWPALGAAVGPSRRAPAPRSPRPSGTCSPSRGERPSPARSADAAVPAAPAPAPRVVSRRSRRWPSRRRARSPSPVQRLSRCAIGRFWVSTEGHRPRRRMGGGGLRERGVPDQLPDLIGASGREQLTPVAGLTCPLQNDGTGAACPPPGGRVIGDDWAPTTTNCAGPAASPREWRGDRRPDAPALPGRRTALPDPPGLPYSKD